MAQEKPNRLVEWLLLLRQNYPVARRHVRMWLEAVKEEPTLIWQTPAVRYATYGVGGLILAWIVSGLAGWFTPPPPVGAKPVATTADYHVVCSAPNCGQHFVVHRKFGFRGFPLTCPKCRQVTGMQAIKCNSSTCQGKWVIPAAEGDALVCPMCGGTLRP